MFRMMIGSIAVASLAACSGADNSDLFDPDPVVQQVDGTDPSKGSGGRPVGSEGPAASPPSAPPDGGAPPPPPKPACTEEGASNDRIADATPFDGCLTGKVVGADTDYGAIDAPKTATKIAIEHEEVGGKVSYRIFINGVAATAAWSGDPPDVPVIPGAKYQFQMRVSTSGSTNAERTYVLRVTFE